MPVKWAPHLLLAVSHRGNMQSKKRTRHQEIIRDAAGEIETKRCGSRLTPRGAVSADDASRAKRSRGWLATQLAVDTCYQPLTAR